METSLAEIFLDILQFLVEPKSNSVLKLKKYVSLRTKSQRFKNYYTVKY